MLALIKRLISINSLQWLLMKACITKLFSRNLQHVNICMGTWRRNYKISIGAVTEIAGSFQTLSQVHNRTNFNEVRVSPQHDSLNEVRGSVKLQRDNIRWHELITLWRQIGQKKLSITSRKIRPTVRYRKWSYRLHRFVYTKEISF